MLKEALEFLRSNQRPEVVEHAGRKFIVTAGDAAEELAPRVREAAVAVGTLQGFAEAALEIGQEADGDATLIVVGGPPQWPVSFLSSIRDGQREVRLLAQWPGDGRIDTIAGSPTEVIVNVQVLMESTEERARLMQTLGSVVDVTEVQTEDDGVSQRMSGKNLAGPGLGWQKVANPFLLTPRVTYDEVEAPTVPYVLRLQKPRPDAPVAAHLFPLKGTQWRTETIRAIVSRLRQLLPEYADRIVG